LNKWYSYKVLQSRIIYMSVGQPSYGVYVQGIPTMRNNQRKIKIQVQGQ
jgi:hypothetical protein